MNIYKEYLASPIGTLVIEADNEAITSIKILPAGKVPEEGDSFEALGLCVDVVKMDGRRVEDLHIVDARIDEDEEEEDAKKPKEKDPEEE